MAANIFTNLVSSFGLKSNGVNAFDVVNGVPVRINNYQGNATVYVYCGKEKAPSIIGPIRDAADAAGLKKPSVSGDSIIFGFKNAKMAVSNYEAIRSIISNNAGVLTVDQCPYCSMGSCDTAGMYGNTAARRMHRQCYLNNRNAAISKVQNSEGNYITGILGALIAAVLIVAFADLLVLGLNRIFYILYLGFPLFIAGGFRLGKGPYGAGGTFCHVTISILAMYVYFYIQGCYYASQMYRVTMFEAVPYFGDVMEIVTHPEFLKESALEIVLFVIGLIIAIFANPNSKTAGTKSAQQNDVFLTPLSRVDTGFSGYDTYGSDSYRNDTVQSSFSDAFGNSGNTQTQQGYTDVYGNARQSQGYTDVYGNAQPQQGYTDVYGNAGTQDGTASGSDWNQVYGSDDTNVK